MHREHRADEREAQTPSLIADARLQGASRMPIPMGARGQGRSWQLVFREELVVSNLDGWCKAWDGGMADWRARLEDDSNSDAVVSECVRMPKTSNGHACK
jgi:hypothetical protein